MTRKRCKELLPIMQAFVDGKEIQFKDKTSEEWVNLVNDDSTFCINDWCEYRIKPTEEYRPYKNTDELIADYKARFNTNCSSYAMPLIWVKHKTIGYKRLITGLSGNVIGLSDKWENMQELFDVYEYLDGSKIGVHV